MLYAGTDSVFLCRTEPMLPVGTVPIGAHDISHGNQTRGSQQCIIPLACTPPDIPFPLNNLPHLKVIDLLVHKNIMTHKTGILNLLYLVLLVELAVIVPGGRLAFGCGRLLVGLLGKRFWDGLVGVAEGLLLRRLLVRVGVGVRLLCG